MNLRVGLAISFMERQYDIARLHRMSLSLDLHSCETPYDVFNIIYPYRARHASNRVNDFNFHAQLCCSVSMLPERTVKHCIYPCFKEVP
ncbi:hypothetical protein VNO77_41848 [Canavalia gladiata]|uniref:Uncharacterized protein n=1 Tax=Canavalia gladiata TaxID=3824 RepID=A0AAN9K1E7_CANGL